VTHFHEIRYKYKLSDTRDSSEVYFKSQFLLRIVLTGQYTAIRGPGSSVGSDWLRGGPSGDRILVGGVSAPVKTDTEVHPTSSTMGTGSFPREKRPRRGVDHPPHLAPRLKKV